jgi:hypothetical protein
MPVDFLIKALAGIRWSNIFHFSNTLCLNQTWGCAMGTSTAVNYAYLYVGLLKVKRLIPGCYKTCLPFFKPFIDNGIVVWLLQPNE